MHRTLRISEDAARDIDLVLTYIGEQSPLGAELVATRIEKTMALLRMFPFIGLVSKDLPRVRKIRVSKTRLYLVYEVMEEAITVIRVLHGVQEVEG